LQFRLTWHNINVVEKGVTFWPTQYYYVIIIKDIYRAQVRD